jgi:mutator protein MutT
MAGGWEFPGGKLEPGESRLAALTRELAEETGVVVEAAHALMRFSHAYADRNVDLDFWRVTQYRGEPRGLDGQRLHWCHPENLAQADLLPADAPVVTVLRLPERIVAAAGPGYRIVPATAAGAAGEAGAETRGARGELLGLLCDSVQGGETAVACGADFLVLSQPLIESDIVALCRAVRVPVYVRGVSLAQAWEMGASGISDFETYARHGQT